ncbi:energy-coupling factor ABC transporter ATP-binding protein [Streptomyces sp. OK228]|uniref:energy-coupling factor ABC transporter ATP-binding protein n=1 Tax=Streptomyces sp. OK228 TaxID=1882786 RepID=UPI000BC7F325|nr:ABC transporter ATP-binding protein [Streptomyces sp. OK228]SOE32743.1 energy-coupling factor transport system ATP-binding protein [Streptomyces sp. OK228]
MVLRVDSLSHRYPNGTAALADVSLTVRAGERVAVVGPNGAGKSTLARHLIGIARPTSGTVTVDGRDAAGLEIAELARSVGFVFQNPDDQLHAATVAKEVGFGPRNLGFPADRRTALTQWALQVTGLTGEANSHPRHLSFGERKRVAFASVLAMDTPIIVLDEPTTGQDHRSVVLLEELVTDLHERGKTILAITHDTDFCAENFDRVVVLSEGRVRWDGPVERWLEGDRNPSMSAFEQPQMARLGRRLGWPTPVATVDGFLDQLTDHAAAR